MNLVNQDTFYGMRVFPVRLTLLQLWYDTIPCVLLNCYNYNVQILRKCIHTGMCRELAQSFPKGMCSIIALFWWELKNISNYCRFLFGSSFSTTAKMKV